MKSRGCKTDVQDLAARYPCGSSCDCSCCNLTDWRREREAVVGYHAAVQTRHAQELDALRAKRDQVRSEWFGVLEA